MSRRSFLLSDLKQDDGDVDDHEDDDDDGDGDVLPVR